MKTLLPFKTYLYQSTRYNVPEDVNPICTYVGTGKNGESTYQNNRSLSEIQERYHPINSSRIDHGLCVHRRWPMSICSIRVLATTVWYGYCPWSSERSGTLTSLPTSNGIKKPNRRFSLTWSLQISLPFFAYLSTTSISSAVAVDWGLPCARPSGYHVTWQQAYRYSQWPFSARSASTTYG